LGVESRQPAKIHRRMRAVHGNICVPNSHERLSQTVSPRLTVNG
jgi:hypothetical protein